jgi:hypothetical protein
MMANIFEPTAEQQAQWAEWVSSRPANVRAVAERFNPWTLYRMKSTGQRVTVYSFQEHKDGTGTVTLTVNITGQFNVLIHDRQVFGIDPADLEPCELPKPEEIVGTLLTPEEAESNLDALRVMVRPDLWELNEKGEAVRK